MSVPSVLAVLVVHDGGAWIERVLQSLARQTHARFGVMAIDNASTDGSGATLERVLGPRRVIRYEENHGFPAVMRRAMELPAASEADYLLFLHDDAALDPEAVTRLVEAAERLDGVGVVGPKVVDWEDPTVLREVGFAADRFGFPHSPLEPGEIDQGQYDAPREVLFVSSAAMLVAREAWSRAGPPDDRLGPCHADLGFCWKVRLAGFRVLVAPRAVASHRMAAARGERGRGPTGRERYHIERAALASLLTNQRLLTLLWLLPVFGAQGLVRLAYALVTRRLDEAGQMIGAWGWNVAHLPGTVARRVRAQAARRIRDHEVARFLTAGTPLQRWVLQGSALLTGHRSAAVEEGEEAEDVPFGRRVASILVARPVLVGLVAGLALTLMAFRGVLFAATIEGGALPTLPQTAGSFFRELGSSWRTFGFGGDGSPSPALALLGAGSFLTFGTPQLLAKVVVAFTPLLAGASCYRAVRRLPVPGVSALAAGSAYGLSALTLWTASDGRLPEAAAVIAVPWLAGRARTAVRGAGPAHPWRWIVGTGMGLAVAAVFFPWIWISLVALVVPLAVIPERDHRIGRGLGLTVAAVVTAAVLIFPFVVTMVLEGGPNGVQVGWPSALHLLRLAPGEAPGAGPAAWFLPIAALIAFAVADGEGSRAAWRALFTVAATVPLAWLAAAGYLPEPVAAPVAFVAVAAFSMAVLVALATGALFGIGRRTAFGARQIAVALLGVVLAGGIAAQSLVAVAGTWAVGEDRIPPAWPVVASSEPAGPFRALWLRRPDGQRFIAPGGDPHGVVEAGEASVAYAVTGRNGRSVLSLASPAGRDAYEALERTLEAVLGGGVRHGGALLAPFAIRYVVAEPGTLPDATAERLADQVDLDLVQRAGGLLLYRNPRQLPEAAMFPPEAGPATRDTSLLAPTAIDPGLSVPLPGRGATRRGVATDGGVAVIADVFDPAWGPGTPYPAYGWAIGLDVPPEAEGLGFDGRVPWLAQLGGMAALWLLALWIVRRRPAEESAGARPALRPATGRRVPAGRAS